MSNQKVWLLQTSRLILYLLDQTHRFSTEIKGKLRYAVFMRYNRVTTFPLKVCAKWTGD